MSRVVLPASPDLDSCESVATFCENVRKVYDLPLNTRFAIVWLANDAACVKVAEDELRHRVRTCRRQGLTWAQIGHCLGISHQAAQQRFGRYTDK